MNRPFHIHLSSPAEQFRLAGRVAGFFTIVLWLAFVVYEYFRNGPPIMSSSVVNQVAALAVVFAGYLIGWRNELAGGLLAVFGTIAFLIVCAIGTRVLPYPEQMFFAVPGLLYLAAWHYDHKTSNT
jgi:hypothetical protein